MIGNLSEVADAMGVDQNTLRAWIKQGAPIIQRGARGLPWKIDSGAIREWREEQTRLSVAGQIEAMDIDEARRKKLAAEAEITELELMKARGEVVLIQDAVDRKREDYSRVRAKLLALPAKLAALMVGLDLREGKDVASKMINECLAELADAA